MADTLYTITTAFLIFCLTISTTVSNNSLSAQSQIEIRAEAQFEYYKIFSDLEKRINEKNPQTFDELKQIAKDYFLERADHLKNLNQGVKLELCNMFSDTSNLVLGSPYPKELCETFASPNDAPHIPWEECRYVKDQIAGTYLHKAGSNLVIDAALSKDQLVLGDNQTIAVQVNSSTSKAAERNATVQVSMSDSSGKGIHSTRGKTDANGIFFHSWRVNSTSPDSFYSVTVLVKDPESPNWVSGTLYFNRTPAQMPFMRICPWDEENIPPS